MLEKLAPAFGRAEAGGWCHPEFKTRWFNDSRYPHCKYYIIIYIYYITTVSRMSSEGFPFGDLRVERSSLRVGVADASVRERYCVQEVSRGSV